jgi:translation initiation factor 3 subunit C
MLLLYTHGNVCWFHHVFHYLTSISHTSFSLSRHPFPLSSIQSKGSDDSDDDDDDSNDDDASWASGSDSSSSSDDEDAGAYAQLKGRARWLKKNTVSKEKVVKNKDERAKQRAEAREKALLATAAKEAVTATKSILPEEGLTASLLERKVKELAAQRGRKNKDNRAILRQLEALSRLSLKFGPRVEVPILMQVIAAEFGLLRTMDDYMDIATWKSCASYLERVADVLEEGYTLGVEMVDEAGLFLTSKGEATSKMKATAKATDGAMAAFSADEKLVNPHTGEVETEDERAERQRVEKEATLTEEEKKVINVVGSLSLHMSRLEEEYTKSLQKISQHSPEYIARLRDECKLVELLSRFQNYFEAQGSDEEAAMLAQLRIEHIYYRHDTIAIQVDKAALFYKQHGEVDMLHPGCIFSEKPTGSQLLDFTQIHPGAAEGTPVIDDPPVVNYGSIMAELCEYVYKHGTEQAKIRATICHIYHHALHDRFVDARDLLLMSHLQDTIYGCDDVITMVLYNRMMANVGMCAFRVGRIYDAHQCLSEICSGRVRELLAQGVQSGRFHNDKTADQEKAEKRRQVPYHQHINLDLLDACHLISAMLLEVPNMAEAAAGSSRRYQRTLSRNFRKLVDQYNHQVFTGPPEQTRDFVMSATKALMKGDWVTCSDLLMNLDVWQLVPGDNATQEIGAMLIGKIKLEALRTYLFAFSKQYQSLSLNVLTAMFDMTKNEVHSVVSKMIINRELGASWDQPTETIVLRKSDPSPLQILSLQLAEKTAHLVESNERLLDAQSGNHGFKEEWKDGDEHHRWHNRGDRGGRGGGGGYRGNVGGRGRGGGGNDRGGRGGGNDRGGRGGGNDRNSGGRGGRGRSGGGRGGGRGRKY